MQMKFLANYSRRAGPSGLGEGLRGGQHHTELLPRTSPSSRCYKKAAGLIQGSNPCCAGCCSGPGVLEDAGPGSWLCVLLTRCFWHN